MKTIINTILALSVLLVCVGCAKNNSSTSNGTVVIKNARVIVGNGDVLPSASVVIKDGRVESVSTQDVNISGAQVIDGTGNSLMPGIIDAHLHIFYSFEKGEQVYRAMLENQAPGFMKSFLKYGVTTIKEMNDPLDIVLELRQQLRDKKIPGPRLLAVGPDFTFPDGHPASTLAADDPWLRKEIAVEVDNPETAREAVRKLAKPSLMKPTNRTCALLSTPGMSRMPLIRWKPGRMGSNTVWLA